MSAVHNSMNGTHVIFTSYLFFTYKQTLLLNLKLFINTKHAPISSHFLHFHPLFNPISRYLSLKSGRNPSVFLLVETGF